MMMSRPQAIVRLGETFLKVPTRNIVTTVVQKGTIRGSTFAEQFTSKWRQEAKLFNSQATWREKMFGPSTGMPFIYGSYAIAGASAIGIGMLCYYGLGMSNEVSAVDRSAMWPEYVRKRLHHTYAYLFAGLGMTAAAGIASTRSPMIMSFTSRGTAWAMLGTIVAMIGTGELTRSIPYENTVIKHLAWASHCGVMGAVMAPLCYLGGPLLLRAAWYTAGIMGGLSITAMCAPSEKFLKMSAPLAMGLGVVFVSNIGAIFLPPGSVIGTGLAAMVIYGGLILFSAFVLHDTQRIIKVAEVMPAPGNNNSVDRYGNKYHFVAFRGYDPINAQMSLYLDALNIFMRLALILGGGSGNQRRQ